MTPSELYALPQMARNPGGGGNPTLAAAASFPGGFH